jgi:hypothetical protein
MVKKSTKVELMDFFYHIDKNAGSPSRQAFAQAREKISYEAFKELFEDSCLIAICDDEAKKFKGYRLFAVDGTSFVVGLTGVSQEWFGESTAVSGKAMCRISGVVDVLEDCIVHAAVSPFGKGERALAIKQIEDLESVCDALFLFDRGYWSPVLVKSIICNSQKFLMRIQASNFNAAKKQGLRIFSFILPGGTEEILATNFPEDEVSNDELVCLYAKRWGIETKYLELKDRLQIDSFSGESNNIILQDIYATLYMSNLVAFACSDADAIIEEKTAAKNNRYKQKANRSICIAAFRMRFVDIFFLEDGRAGAAAFDRLRDDIAKCVTYERKSIPRPRRANRLKNVRRSSAKSPL